MTAETPFATFSSAEQRKIFSLVPTSVVAITGMTVENKPMGLIVGTFQSLSLDPPLVTFSVAKSSSTWPVLRSMGRFTANVLSSDQAQICKALGRKGDDKFSGLVYDKSVIDTPRLPGSSAWIDCHVLSEIVAGDHFVIVGSIAAMDVGDAAGPMIFCEGKFGSYAALPPPGTEEERALTKRQFVNKLVDAWTRAWGAGETAAFEAIAASDYVRHSKEGREVRLPGMIKQIEESHRAFSDFKVEVLHALAEGDMVAIYWRTIAKHTGTFMDVGPTQKSVVVSGASFLKHKDGRILQEWVSWDPRELLASMRIWHLGD